MPGTPHERWGESLGWTGSIDNMHNLSGSFWCSKVCLWSLEGCAFLKRAVFLSSYLSAHSFQVLHMTFHMELFLLLIKGRELGELKCSHLCALFSSLPWSWSLITPSTLCAHTISPLLLTQSSITWVRQTPGQAPVLFVLLQMYQAAARASCAGSLLYPGAVLHFWNTLKVYKPTCRWSACCQLLTHMAGTVLLVT